MLSGSSAASIRANMSFRWLALRKLNPLLVSRTCATLSSRVPVNLKGVPPEQPKATSAAARARRARLRRGLDELLNDMLG